MMSPDPARNEQLRGMRAGFLMVVAFWVAVAALGFAIKVLT